MNQPPHPWIVLKFGGAGLASREQWNVMADVITRRLKEGLRPLVVFSALPDVTNRLDALLDETDGQKQREQLTEIKRRHVEVAHSLGLDTDALQPTLSALERLERLVEGAALFRRVPPSLRAEVLAQGELLVTRIAAAFLEAALEDPPGSSDESANVETPAAVAWQDARDLLQAREDVREHETRRYLSATCEFAPNAETQEKLGNLAEAVVVTQGFIARNKGGETVLIGREGSDTSATSLAAILEAERVEIWTDVPGIFSANPRMIPSAQLLRHLDYDEAQELAVTGAKVLHPRALGPVRTYDIPLHIYGIDEPDADGTIITGETPSRHPHVKGLAAKKGVMLVEMRTPEMWQDTGFMADAFATFKSHGLTLDLVATSETDVTVSLHPDASALDPSVVDAAVEELNTYCNARLIGPCAAISLVGRSIRSILHQLGPAFELFEEHHVYLVSQAAGDLNFTFVVDEEQADRLVRSLHAELFTAAADDALFGPSWESITRPAETAERTPPWWRRRRKELLQLTESEGPCYVYDADTLRHAAEMLRPVSAVDRFFYSVKANPHPSILKLFDALDLGFECVSIDELRHVRKTLPDLPTDRILFTPNFAPREEYQAAIDDGVMFTLDNIYPLEAWPDVFRGRELIVRVDPGYGRGHHKHVRTAGSRSKFGIPLSEMERVQRLTDDLEAPVVGLHAHAGSNIFAEDHWADVAEVLAEQAARFPDIRILNLGGGLGIAEQPGGRELDMEAVGSHLASFKASYRKDKERDFELWMEPGRYLVARAGVLLARVTQLKKKGADRHYIGLETGMNSLIRPALYGSYHEIVNLTRLEESPEITATIVGPICESGDVLGHDRRLPAAEEGDVLLIANTGAYGRTMSSDYNLRAPAAEHFLQSEPAMAGEG